MRLRVLALPVCALISLSACGSSPSTTATSTVPAPSTATDTASSVATTPASTDSVTATGSSTAMSTANDASLTTSLDDVPADPTKRVQPGVKVPATVPTTLISNDLIDGSGTEAVTGSTVSFFYVLALDSDGSIVSNNYGQAPVTVQLGTGQLIAGVDQGLIGVKPGTRRQLDIPPDLAYGATGKDPVPPNTAISFVIDVVDVTPPPAPPTVPPQADAADCPAVDGTSPKKETFDKYPPFCIDVKKKYTAKVSTTEGDFTVDLFADKAPLTVNSFVVLARYHYFDGISCHRIVPGFVAQCGDPTGTGSGGPGYSFADELPTAGEYKIGSLAMANSGADTNGSQFFVILGDNGASLPPQYSLFGQVTDGLDTTLPALDKVGNTVDPAPPLKPVTITSVTIEESAG